MNEIEFTCSGFDELGSEELYEILRLRSEVFVVEQDCVYLDTDGNDQVAKHVTGKLDGELVCYTRLLPPGCKYDGASIGRVVTRQSVRRAGLGRPLMERSIAYCREYWPGSTITISAQQYLENFYQSLGFELVSEPYMEDGIPHVEMNLKSDSSA